jgi:tetratricopeptide (TPR) repeat protein
VHYGRLLFLSFAAPLFLHASHVAILVTPFANESQTPDLAWIGESVSETLIAEFGAAGEIVLERETRAEGYRRLGLKSDAAYTKASLLKLGQTLDADMVCYGSYQIVLPSSNAQPRDGSIRISARFLDLRKLRDASEFSETGKLVDLSRLEEHLAWQLIRYVDPESNITIEQLINPSKLVRLDAKESYIRGLLASDREQKEKWLQQAAKLDSHYAQPAFALGELAMRSKDYRQAVVYFGRIPKDDPLYLEARFRMGLSSYAAADFSTARSCFRELAKTVPLNEVFNNLGAAESRLNDPSAFDDFRRAVEGDAADPVYQFNMALVLYRQSKFDEAGQHLRIVLNYRPDDRDASNLLARCEQRQSTAASGSSRSTPTERLKQNFDLTAFRQLKAAVETADKP